MGRKMESSAEAVSALRRLPGNGSTLLVALLLLATAAPLLLAAETIVVSQRNRRFAPDAGTIARGATLHIVNDDRVTHHIFVDSPEMSFDSGEQPIGAVVDVRFDRVGSFRVQCAIHPTMHLEVTVE
jgi:plastocyanin